MHYWRNRKDKLKDVDSKIFGICELLTQVPSVSKDEQERLLDELRKLMIERPFLGGTRGKYERLQTKPPHPAPVR